MASARARTRARRALRAYGADPHRLAAADRRWWSWFVQPERRITIEEVRRGRLADAGVKPEQMAAAELAYRELANAIRLRSGARRMLRELRSLGLATVILTNGTIDPQRVKLETSGLLPLVDAAIVSEEAGWHKPDARAFVAALDLVGGRPEAAAMVGDNLVADISGALDAGFPRAVWMAPRWRRPNPHPLVRTVRRLDQVPPALRG